MTLDIGEVVARAGVPPSKLRYYEEKGLIAATGRRGLRRQYDESVLQTLSLIALGRTAGFSLDDIAGMLLPQGKASIDRAKLAAKADDIDRTLRQLSALRDGLRHAAVCPAPEHLACPQFQRLMRIAGARGKAADKGRKESTGSKSGSGAPAVSVAKKRNAVSGGVRD